MKKKEEIKRTLIKLDNELNINLSHMNELDPEANREEINLIHFTMTEIVIKINTLKWVLKI